MKDPQPAVPLPPIPDLLGRSPGETKGAPFTLGDERYSSQERPPEIVAGLRVEQVYDKELARPMTRASFNLEDFRERTSSLSLKMAAEKSPVISRILPSHELVKIHDAFRTDVNGHEELAFILDQIGENDVPATELTLSPAENAKIQELKAKLADGGWPDVDNSFFIITTQTREMRVRLLPWKLFENSVAVKDAFEQNAILEKIPQVTSQAILPSRENIG